MAKNRAKHNGQSKKSIGFKVAILVCVIMFTWVGYVFSYAAPLLFMDNGQADPAKVETFKKGQFVITLAGSDMRPEETSSRSDTLIMAFIDTKEKTARLFSIPRDTYVTIPGHEKPTKINHAHAYGGIKLTQETVKANFDIDSDYYIDINFQGFSDFIDAIGGVDLDVEKRMYYPDEGIDLKPGQQHLNGHDALAYVRYRSDGMGDLGRIVRQQKFLTALSKQMLSPAMITKLPTALSAISENLKTDLSTKELLTLANIFKDDAYLQTYQMPGDDRYKNHISYVFIVQPDTDEMIAKLKLYEPKPEVPTADGSETPDGSGAASE